MVPEEGLLITSPSRDNIEPTVTDWSNRRSSRKTPPASSPVKGTVLEGCKSLHLPASLAHFGGSVRFRKAYDIDD